MSNVGSIYLSANDPVVRPPDARFSGTPAYNDFTPSYNCTVQYQGPLGAVVTLGSGFWVRGTACALCTLISLQCCWTYGALNPDKRHSDMSQCSSQCYLDWCYVISSTTNHLRPRIVKHMLSSLPCLPCGSAAKQDTLSLQPTINLGCALLTGNQLRHRQACALHTVRDIQFPRCGARSC